MNKTGIFSGPIIALMLIAGPVGAESEKAEETRTDAGHPQKLVKQVTEDVLAALRKDEAKKNGVSEHVEQLILPHLDFVAMSKLVLGKHWRNADEQQRAMFVEQFKQLLIRTYETSLAKYSKEEVVFRPFRESSQPERFAVVNSEIKRANGPTIPIKYSLRHKPEDGWKVYDIAIEGVSLVTNYRSSFSRKINQKGVDHLIESLKQRNRESEAGEPRGSKNG